MRPALSLQRADGCCGKVAMPNTPTPRENHCVQLAGERLSNDATRLGIGTGKVSQYLKSACRKLSVSGRRAAFRAFSQFGGPPQSATVETARLAPRRVKAVSRDPHCSWCHGGFEDVRAPVSACVNRTRPVTSLEVSAHFHRGDGVLNRKEQLNNKTEIILIEITIIVLLILSEYKSIVGI